MTINRLLSLFDLRPIEIKIYQTLFENGVLSAATLAKQSNISRTSVYDLLEKLIKKGLVIETIQDRMKMFSVVSLEKVKILLEEKEKEITEAKNILAQLNVENLKKGRFLTPLLQIFEGREALQQMMKDMLLYRDITVYAFWPIKKIITLLTSEFLEKFHQERVARNINIKVIWPKNQILKFQEYPYLINNPKWKREVRIAPSEISFSLGYAIYGNTVRFISSQRENFGFLVESQELVEMMKSQFQVIWKVSKLLKTTKNR